VRLHLSRFRDTPHPQQGFKPGTYGSIAEALADAAIELGINSAELAVGAGAVAGAGLEWYQLGHQLVLHEFGRPAGFAEPEAEVAA